MLKNHCLEISEIASSHWPPLLASTITGSTWHHTHVGWATCGHN